MDLIAKELTFMVINKKRLFILHICCLISCTAGHAKTPLFTEIAKVHDAPQEPKNGHPQSSVTLISVNSIPPYGPDKRPGIDRLAYAGHPGNWWALVCDNKGEPVLLHIRSADRPDQHLFGGCNPQTFK
jgi:hypothetical protein